MRIFDIDLKSKSVLSKIFNPYVFISIIFIFIMIFSDYSFVSCVRLSSDVKNLENRKTHYQKEIQLTRTSIKQFNANHGDMERLAREKYLMHKKDEEVFLIKGVEDEPNLEIDEDAPAY